MTSPEPSADPSSTEPAVDVVLRPALDIDADGIAEVLLAARAGSVRAGTMPAPVHPASDMLRHVLEDVLPYREVWVAHAPAADDPDEGPVVGVMALAEAWLDDLYVIPARAGEGIGSALLQLAKARRPAGFDLWVFEVNAPAQRFYERHGLVEVERTDGSENDERAPDRRYHWPGSG